MLTPYLIEQRKKDVDRMDGERKSTLEKYVSKDG